MAVTDSLRERVRAELPEAGEIIDAALRDKVIEAWATALANSSFEAIADIRPSGNPDTPPLRKGTQTDHIRGVTRLAMGMADELVVRSLENTIVNAADYAFWRVLRAGGLLADD